MYAVALSKDVFNRSPNINDQGACATLASKRLLDRLIQLAERTRKRMCKLNQSLSSVIR